MNSIRSKHDPTFSICHTTARPHAWRKSYDAFLTQCVDPFSIQYILCVDERWGFKRAPDLRPIDRTIWNEGRKCSVDGWNAAADASTGDILIISSDDMFPSKDWDRELLKSVTALNKNPEKDEFVLEVSSGKGADARRLMVCQILSRARYERLGYALYREYESLRVDVDFTEHARHDGVVIDCRHVSIEHRHPAEGFGATDAVYDYENRRESFLMGDAILQRRRALEFA